MAGDISRRLAVAGGWGHLLKAGVFLMDVSPVEQQEAALPIPAVNVGTEGP